MGIDLSSVADAFAREFQCWSSEESGRVMGSLLARISGYVEDEAERAWLVERATTSGIRLPAPVLSRVALDSELGYVGAGDAVCVISADGRSFEHRSAILVDVHGDDATVNVGGEWSGTSYSRVAHPDSPAAMAVAKIEEEE